MIPGPRKLKITTIETASHTFNYMYIIERLKNDYPAYMEELDAYDKFLRRYYSDDLLFKIYDDRKPSFYWVNKAFKCGPGKKGYNKNMAYYQNAINFDIDFLRSIVKDSDNMSVDELRKSLLGEHYNPVREDELKNKLKERND